MTDTREVILKRYHEQELNIASKLRWGLQALNSMLIARRIFTGNKRYTRVLLWTMTTSASLGFYERMLRTELGDPLVDHALVKQRITDAMNKFTDEHTT